MRKISKGLSCTMVVLSILVSSFFIQFESSAAEYSYNSAHCEPSYGDNSGYLNVLVDNDYSGYIFYTLAWNMLSTASEDVAFSSYVDIVINQRSVTLNYGANTNYSFTCFELNSGGSAYLLRSKTTASGSSSSLSSSYNGTIVAVSMKGNYGVVSYYGGSYLPQVSVTWNNETQNIGKLAEIVNMIQVLNTNLGGKLDTLVSRINVLISEVDSVEETLSSVKNLLAEYYPKFETELKNIVSRLDTLIAQSAGDKQATDKFDEDSQSQSEAIKDLNEQNKVNKTDVDSASGSVDEYIDGESIASYGTLLSVFTNNEYILRMILIVLAIGLVSYVLFGKR